MPKPIKSPAKKSRGTDRKSLFKEFGLTYPLDNRPIVNMPVVVHVAHGAYVTISGSIKGGGRRRVTVFAGQGLMVGFEGAGHAVVSVHDGDNLAVVVEHWGITARSLWHEDVAKLSAMPPVLDAQQPGQQVVIIDCNERFSPDEDFGEYAVTLTAS